MYPTDVTDAQWQVIEKYVEIQTRKRKYSIRNIWNAIMYLVKTGCQWRMLPINFAKWQLVYYYYRKWVSSGIFDRILDKLRAVVRLKRGQSSQATLGIMDSQSVRWGNNRSLNSYDGNKKVKGIKRHVVVDKNGFLLAVMVAVASIHDSKAVIQLMKVLREAYANIKLIWADRGYQAAVIAAVKQRFTYLIQIVTRQDKSKDFKPIPKRWVVERTFAWFDNDRRLCRNYELLLESSEEMVKLAAIKILVRKI